MKAKPKPQQHTNIQAEEAILGAILLDNTVFARVVEILQKGDFYREAHRRIFAAMKHLHAQDKPIDLLTLTEQMRKDGTLDESGGEPYVAALVDAVATAEGILQHARLVKEEAKFRDLQVVADAIKDSMGGADASEDVANRLRPVLEGFAEKGPGWKPPLPFETTVGPPFPIEVLPSSLGNFVEEVTEARQVPPDLPGVLVIGALAASMGGKARIEINPSYSEPLNLFVASVLGPGTRKSAVFADAVGPIMDWERQKTEEMRSQIAAAKQEREIEEMRLRRLQKKASGENDPEKRRASVQEAAQIAESLGEPPRFPRYIADDVTPERLAGLLAEQGGRIAVMSPEGGIFGIMVGRYSQNGDSNLEVFLKGHAGDALRVDRIGRPPEHVEKPALTMALAVQPEVLRKAAAHAELRKRGLLARFLFSIPDDRVGQRQYRSGGINTAAQRAYGETLHLLLGFSSPENRSAIPSLRLDDEAMDEWIRFHNEIESSLARGGTLRPIRDWASKLAGAVTRIAGLLHLAEHPSVSQGLRIPVDVETILCAVALGEYFRDHALVAFGLMGADPEIETARDIQGWILRHEKRVFTLRDLHQHHRRVKKPEDLLNPLGLLKSRGYIRKLPAPKKQGAGRQPSPRFQVNPIWLTQNSQNSQKPIEHVNFVTSVNSVEGESK